VDPKPEVVRSKLFGGISFEMELAVRGKAKAVGLTGHV